ncbi:MAG: ATP-binding protein [Oligoflexia bacterium]|nr:ATP-binding protein [Oligoflexia bacterium]
MQHQRTLSAILRREREKYEKMIFVTGPRQVGKTTILHQLIQYFPGPIFNWDNLDDRHLISTSPRSIFAENEHVYFDEIHKAPRWKNFLKGYFDKYWEQCRIWVTGSARLDVYRRGGDSLLGRYILFRLHPFSVGEILHPDQVPCELEIADILESDETDLPKAHEAWERLKVHGGFPESFLTQSLEFTRKWRAQRHERLVREDIRDLTRIRELALLEQMVALIPSRIGQPFSLNAMREDLEVSHDSIRLWTQCLEEFYYFYFISPYSKRMPRASKKERKVYLWDYSEVSEAGALFENMVASHLLKWAHTTQDMGYREININYIKNKEKQEVDFLVTREKTPLLLIEAKLSDETPSRQALKLSAQLGNIPVLQLVDRPGVFMKRKCEGIQWTLMSASRFCKALP